MRQSVKLSIFPDWPLERQMPGGGPAWEEFDFHINSAVEEADFWVVSIGLLDAERCVVPPNRTLFVTYEPSCVHRYAPGYLAQFAHILTCQRSIDHPCVTYGPQGQQWFAGLSWPDLAVTESFDSFTAEAPVAKTGTISMVTTRKVLTRAHERRLQMVERLQRAFAGVLDIYGTGFQRVPDKLQAIRPYKYHIVFENSQEPDYFSEKLADAFLGWSYPLYWGCPNVAEFLPREAMQALPGDDYDAMARSIEQVLRDDPYSRKLPAITAARDIIMKKQNFFGRIASVLREMALQPAAAPVPVLLRDERHFTQRSRSAQLIRNTRSLARRARGTNIPKRGAPAF